MLLPYIIGSLVFGFHIGYFIGQRGKRKQQQAYALELSQLARETVQRDLELAKLEALIQSAIEQNVQENQ